MESSLVSVMVTSKKSPPPNQSSYTMKRTKPEKTFKTTPKTGKPKQLKKNESWKRIAKEANLEKLNGPSEFHPEIRIKNRIIEQLTKEYEGKLAPVKKKSVMRESEVFEAKMATTKKKTVQFSKEAEVLPRGLTNFAFQDSPVLSPKGLINEAFQDSPLTPKIGVTNPCFEDSPIEKGLANPCFVVSPIGELNEGFLDSPGEIVIKGNGDIRTATEVTPRKSRVDRHQQRRVVEELQTLYEEEEEEVVEVDGEKEHADSFEMRKMSLGEFLPVDFKGKGGGLSRKFMRMGSVMQNKKKDKMRRVSTVANVGVKGPSGM